MPWEYEDSCPHPYEKDGSPRKPTWLCEGCHAIAEHGRDLLARCREALDCILTGTVPAKSPPDTNPDGADSWSAVETWRVDRAREVLAAVKRDLEALP